MKIWKRILPVMLAAALMIALAVPALAEEELGSIQIENAVANTTYTIYRLLDLSDHTTEKDEDGYIGVRYKVAEGWEDFFKETDAGAGYVTIKQGYVTWTADSDSATVQAFAAKAKKYAEDNQITSSGTKTADADGSDVVFDKLPLGYYLVCSGLDAICSLDTTRPNAVIAEKNSKPTNEKKVREDDDANDATAWRDENDADIGQKVAFRSVIQVLDGQPSNYVFHDKMGNGLTFTTDGLTVTRNDRAMDAEKDYTLSAAGLNDGCTFEIYFAEGVLQPNDEVVVTYYATVNENAVVGGSGEEDTANRNQSRVTYGEDSSTTWDSTVTETWALNVLKYTLVKTETEGSVENPDGVETQAVSATEKSLAGAGFVLYQQDGQNNKRYLQATAATEQGKDSVYTVSGWTESGVSQGRTEMVTPETGRFSIRGLDSGVYYLEEIYAPAGYALLDEPIKVQIDNQGKVRYPGEDGTFSGDALADGLVKVENYAGPSMPETGGVGTTVFYVLGTALVLGAGVFLLSEKKAKEEE